MPARPDLDAEARRIAAQRRDARLLLLRRQGKPVAEAARRLNLTERHAYRILAQLRSA